jgi:Transglutaminase-like superfamily
MALPVIEGCLKLFGVRAISRVLGSWPKTGAVSPNAEDLEVELHARLLSIARRNHILPGKCLAQSLTLWWSLRRLSISSDLRIGIRKENGQFFSHAWVEYKGKALIDAESVRGRYIVFDQPVSRDWIWSS